MTAFTDMDGNALKIGDIVLFGTGAKTIARATIISMEHGVLELHTLKNRKTKMIARHVLLEKSV